MIPAFFIDILLRIAGKKPMLFDIQRKIYIANVVLEYFMTNTWRFVNEKTFNLYNELSEEDKAVFGVGRKHIEWEKAGVFDYLRNGLIGLSMYLLKEEFDFTRKISRRNLWRFWIIDRIVKTITLVLAVWFLTVKWNVFSLSFLALQDYIRSI
ncbi:hypothetical protein JTB14_028276 [Gonioctena quinquepunctata]|nr:hypothetical protein JTB14_028276 [Gonioctena quinquepunctata]